jgi:hypothetical protein
MLGVLIVFRGTFGLGSFDGLLNTIYSLFKSITLTLFRQYQKLALKEVKLTS